MNAKILKGIIIAFFFSFLLVLEEMKACRELDETKEVIRRNFNWTFISVLNDDFHFLPSKRKDKDVS